MCKVAERSVHQRVIYPAHSRPLQALERGDPKAALRVLQQELGGLQVKWEQRLHALAGCLLCTSSEALQKHVGWFGTKDHKNREQLLRDLQAPLSP